MTTPEGISDDTTPVRPQERILGEIPTGKGHGHIRNHLLEAEVSLEASFLSSANEDEPSDSHSLRSIACSLAVIAKALHETNERERGNQRGAKDYLDALHDDARRSVISADEYARRAGIKLEGQDHPPVQTDATKAYLARRFVGESSADFARRVRINTDAP